MNLFYMQQWSNASRKAEKQSSRKRKKQERNALEATCSTKLAPPSFETPTKTCSPSCLTFLPRIEAVFASRIEMLLIKDSAHLFLVKTAEEMQKRASRKILQKKEEKV